jgi:hypothetical protein
MSLTGTGFGGVKAVLAKACLRGLLVSVADENGLPGIDKLC